MQLVINTFGAFLHKHQDLFRINIKEQKYQFSPQKIDSILITSGASFSSDAVELAIEHNIDFIFLNKYGNPYARIWRPKLGSTAAIRRRQLELSESTQGYLSALQLIQKKFDGQIRLLKQLGRTRQGDSVSLLEKGIAGIQSLGKKLDTVKPEAENIAGTLRGLEGSAGRIYFGTIAHILPKDYQFDGRSRDPAADYFNCLLNYGYGMLYGMVERACILAGLDPHVGLLHTDNYNKKSFVFDMIEPFRPYIDEVVIKLITTRQIKHNYFDEIPAGFTLNKLGKEILIPAVNDFFEESVRYHGRNIQRKHTIQYECHRMANAWLGREEEPDVNVVETQELEEDTQDRDVL